MNEVLNIENHESVSLQGATKLLSATATLAVICTDDITITITGNNLELAKLDLENKYVSFTGNVTCVKYSKRAGKVSLIKRIFK